MTNQNIRPFYSLLEQDYLVFDTETTGLGNSAEMCEIAFIDGKDGKTLLSTKVKPVGEIELGASKVHGIYAEDVKDSPTWKDIYYDLLPQLVTNKLLVAYNAAFDLRILYQSSLANGIQDDGKHHSVGFYCAMLEFSHYAKVYQHLQGGYKWFKLADAAELVGVTASGDLHGAEVDSKLTHNVIKRVQGLLYNV